MSYVIGAAPLAHVQGYEARRAFVVRAVMFIYILSLVEGPLRKWFLPGLAAPLTLLRDPFVIALYAHALLSGLMMRRGMAALWLGFAAVTSWFGLLQYMAGGLGLSGWMLGVRTYWLYMPLAFVVGSAFRPDDVLRFLRFNLWIALPYAALVATQYGAGASSFINLGVGGDEEAAVGVADGILRPFGLFTYTAPNVQFTAAMVAMLAAIFLADRSERPSKLIFLTMVLSVAAMSVLTGSRGIYFVAAIILGFTAMGLMIARPRGTALVQVIMLMAFVPVVPVLFAQVFPDMFAAMSVRFEQASGSEGSIFGRAFGEVIAPIRAFDTAPILGHGIGAGAPGVARFIGVPPLTYGESDLQRNVNELGVFLGLVMLLLRMGMAVWLVLAALRIAQRGRVIVLPLAGFCLTPFVVGQITNSPIDAFLVWLFAGLVIANKEEKFSQKGTRNDC